MLKLCWRFRMEKYNFRLESSLIRLEAGGSGHNFSNSSLQPFCVRNLQPPAQTPSNRVRNLQPASPRGQSPTEVLIRRKSFNSTIFFQENAIHGQIEKLRCFYLLCMHHSSNVGKSTSRASLHMHEAHLILSLPTIKFQFP